VTVRKEIRTIAHIDLSNKPGMVYPISPLGKVPLLKVEDKVLFESCDLRILDEITPSSLHPADPIGKANHRAWIESGS